MSNNSWVPPSLREIAKLSHDRKTVRTNEILDAFRGEMDAFIQRLQGDKSNAPFTSDNTRSIDPNNNSIIS